MNAYELISSDLAARLGLKRLTLAILATSLLSNTFLAAGFLLKKDVVSTVLVPVGINEVTHPVTVAQAHIDEEYFEDRHGVFEFKYVHSSSEVDGLVKEAIDQTQSRRYGEKTDRKELQANITLSFLFFSFVHHVARP